MHIGPGQDLPPGSDEDRRDRHACGRERRAQAARVLWLEDLGASFGLSPVPSPQRHGGGGAGPSPDGPGKAAPPSAQSLAQLRWAAGPGRELRQRRRERQT